VKPNINSVEVHPELSNNRHPVDGGLVGAGALCGPSTQGFLLCEESSSFRKELREKIKIHSQLKNLENIY
jgi:hypothetical protein